MNAWLELLAQQAVTPSRGPFAEDRPKEFGEEVFSGIVDGNQLDDAPLAQVLPGFLIEGTVNVISGASGVGKSMLALQIATYATAGRLPSWLEPVPGEVVTFAPIRTMLVDSEMDQRVTNGRLDALTAGAKFEGIEPDRAGIKWVDGGEAIRRLGVELTEDPGKFVRYLAEVKRRLGVSLFVIDSLASTARVTDENAASAWNWLWEYSYESQRLGVTSVFLAHASKPMTEGDGGGGARGSGAIYSPMWMMLALKPGASVAGSKRLKIAAFSFPQGKDRAGIAEHLAGRTIAMTKAEGVTTITLADAEADAAYHEGRRAGGRKAGTEATKARVQAELFRIRASVRDHLTGEGLNKSQLAEALGVGRRSAPLDALWKELEAGQIEGAKVLDGKAKKG